MREPTNVERTLIFRTLAGVHWSVSVSYENGARRSECGGTIADLIVLHFACCLMNRVPTSRNTPEDNRDPVPADERFLRACGVRPADVRDDLRVLDR